MSIVKRLALVLTGMVIGMVVAWAANPARAAQDLGPDRFTSVSAGKVEGGLSAYFERDSKSGGCWLMLLSGAANVGAQAGIPQATLAQAPSAACEK